MTAAEVVTSDDIRLWVRDFAHLVHGQVAWLNDLDAAIGDGDHGTNLDRGMQAATAAVDDLPEDATIEEVAKKVAMTLVSTVGGASGPLYGTFFLRFAAATAHTPALDASALARAVRAGVDGVAARGKAQAGDKTMLDAWLPACQALEDAADEGVAVAVAAACTAAETGRDATIPLVARKGRASYLGERSAGHLDPGATSTAMLLGCARRVFADGVVP